MTNDPPSEQKSELLSALVSTFRLVGIIGLAFGAIHLVSILTAGYTDVRAGDALVNALIGVLALLTLRTLAQGRLLAIALCGSAVLLSVFYSFAIGRGLNFTSAVVGALGLGALVVLWRRGEIG